MSKRHYSTLAIGFITLLSIELLAYAPMVSSETSSGRSTPEEVSKSYAKTITLVGTQSTKKSFHGRWLDLIYTEVFRRLGFQLNYEGYLAKRASKISDTGQADGEIHRVYDYADKHPNVVRVEEPHFSIHFSAYAIDPSIHLNSWEDLVEKNYKIGYRSGVKKTESKLPAILSENKILSAHSTRQGLRQVMKGRSNAFIDVESVIEDVLKNDTEFKNSKLHKVGVLEEITVHAYLHKKHKHLVTKVAEILKEMKQEGLIKKYKTLALYPLKVVKIAAIDWCPQICLNEKHAGYMIDLVKEVFSDSGYELDIEYYPWSRAIVLARNGVVHALLSPAKAEAPNLLYPKYELGIQRMCFFTTADNTWTYTGSDSLKDMSIGIFNDVSIEELNPYIEKNREQFSSLPHTGVSTDFYRPYNLLKANRIDTFITSEATALYYLNKKELKSEYRNAGCVSSANIFMAFTPIQEHETFTKQLMHHFDKKMQYLNDSEFIKTVMTRYGLSQ